MHTTRVKVWPDGSRDIVIADRAIFREPGWEAAEKSGKKAQAFEPDFEDEPLWETYALERHELLQAAHDAENLSRAKRRARSAVYDLAMASDLRYFVTLTLDKSKVDRYDMVEITRKLNAWLDNHVRRDGLAYVLVPERHKDGAVHFHGFFNDALPLVDSGTIIRAEGGKPRRPRSKAERAAWLAAGGHEVYNLPAWSLGFTTAIHVYGPRRSAVGYACKYITKAHEKVGGRWYYSGGALQRPSVEYLDLQIADFAGVSGAEPWKLEELDCPMLTLTVDSAGEKFTF